MDFAKILLQAGVDVDSSIKNINENVRSMQSQLNKVNLSINISNTKEIDNVIEKIEKLGKALDSTKGAVSVSGFDSSVKDGISSTIKQIDSLIDKEQKHNKLIEDKLFLYKHAKELQMEDLKIKYGEGLDVKALEDFNNRVMSLSVNTDDVTRSMKFLDAEFKEIKQNARIATQEARAHAKAEEDRAKAIAKTQEEKAKQAQKEAQELVKLEAQLKALEAKEKEQNKTLEERIAIWQRIKEIQVNELQFKLGDTVDADRLKGLVDGVKQVSTETDRATHVMKAWDTELRSIRSNAQMLSTELKNAERAEIQAEREAEATRKANEELERKIELFQRAMAIDIDKLQIRFGDTVDSTKLEEFTNKVKALSVDTADADKTIEMLKMEFKELSHETAVGAGAIDTAGMSIKQMGDSAENSFKKLMSFVGIQVSLYTLFNQIKQGVNQINQLDNALTQISIVTGKSRSEVSGLAREYNELAKEMKVTTDAIAQGAVTFYRQGLDQEEVMKRLQTATQFSRITNLEFTDSVEILTATVNSMGVEIERASDIFTKLGDSTATSGAEVARGFSRTSGTAKALGLELERVSSYIAGISAVTRQNAESIGNAMNTIFTRMTNMTATGFTEEGESINNVAKALKQVNIQLEDSPGKWRKQTDVLGNIAEKWDSLNDRQRAYLATTIAGTRQQSIFNNLMENYALTVELYDEAMDSAGTTQEKYALYLESNQAKIDNLKATVEELWITFLDSDSLMQVVETFTKLIEVLIALGDEYGHIIIKMVEFGVPALAMIASLNMIYGGLGKIVSIAKAVTTQVGIMTGAIQATSVATAVLNPVLAGLTVAIGAVGYMFAKSAKEARDAEIAFKNAHKNIGTTADEVIQLSKLEEEYRRLSKTTSKTTEEKERLHEIQRELARLHPELVTGYDNEGRKIAESAEATTNLLKAKEELLAQEKRIFDVMAKQRLPELNKQINDLEEQRLELLALIEKGEDIQPKYYAYDGEYQEGRSLESMIVEYQNIIEVQKELQEEQSNIISQSTEIEGALNKVAEASKWLTAEEIERTVQMSENKEMTQQQIDTLVDLGFTFEEIEKIARGSLTEVREQHELASEANLAHIASLETLDEQSRITYTNMLLDSADATRKLIEQSKARITALREEARIMAQIAGREAKFAQETSPLSKRPSDVDLMSTLTDPLKGGITKIPEFQSKVANRKLQDANRELQESMKTLNDIEKALNNLERIRHDNATSLSRTQSSGARAKSGGASSKKEYQAQADRYAELNRLLAENNTLNDRNRLSRERLRAGTQDMINSIEEEIKISQQRQRILHELNQERRQEVLEIENRLKGIFTFEGEGDNKIITNLEAVQGKSKEVEEDVKRFIELQTNLIPSASTEWANLQLNIEKVSLEKLSNEFKMFDNEVQKLKYTMSDLDFQMKMLESSDLDGKVEITGRQLALARVEAEKLKNELERLRSIEVKEGTQAFYEYQDRIIEVENAYKSAQLSVKGFSDSLESIREGLRKDWVSEQNRQIKEQENALSSIQEKIVQIIRKRGEEEKKAIDEAHKKDMDSLKERHNERVKRYKEELDEYNKFIQAKINALQEQHAEEDYQADLEKERQKALEIQKEIDVLSLDDSIQARAKVIELRKKLAEQNEKIAKKQQDRERKIEIDALKDKMKDRQQEAKDKENLANEWYENEKQRLEEDYQINKEFLDRKYSDEKVYAEARESIIRGTVEVSKGAFVDIYDAFADFEDKFGKGMGILGDIIKDDFISELEKAREAIANLERDGDRWLRKYSDSYDPGDNALGFNRPDIDDYYDEYKGSQKPQEPRRPSEFSNWSDEDYNQYILNKQNWEKVGKNEQAVLANRNALLRAKYWGLDKMWKDDYHWKQLIGSYDKGGFIPRDGIIMAHEQEMYIPTKMQQDLWNAFNDMPNHINRQLEDLNISGGGTIYNVPIKIYGNMDNVTKADLKREMSEALRQYDDRKETNLIKRGLR